jgi:hypothetical protein
VGSGEGIMTKLAAVLFQTNAGSTSLPTFHAAITGTVIRSAASILRPI